MPVFLILLGIAVLVIGMRGRAGDATTLLASEFTGPNSFIQWFLAIMVLGLVGYIRPVRPVADGMLGLVLLVLVIAKGGGANGFIAAIEGAFQNTQPLSAKPLVTPPDPAGATAGLNVPGLTSPLITQLPTNADAAQALSPSITQLPTDADAAAALQPFNVSSLLF